MQDETAHVLMLLWGVGISQSSCLMSEMNLTCVFAVLRYAGQLFDQLHCRQSVRRVAVRAYSF
jgi:hypothetical protein